MRLRVAALLVLVLIAYGCASTASAPGPGASELLHGIASWYGEEFAGRTTANGEIFDPLLLTAAHRTLPFGTVLDITNPETKKSVRVRVNDRGPYIGNRLIDLSYAAAQQIGLIEPGVGTVDIAVVKIGSGDREPPAPLEVTIAGAPVTVSAVAATPRAVEPPPVAFPLPVPQTATTEPVVVDRIVVEEQRGGMITRKQVAADGRTIESVPVKPGEAPPPAESYDAQRERPAAAVIPKGLFHVQVGAFASEANAELLRARLTSIGQRAWIHRAELFRVRIGPFATREQALQARTALEAQGLSAIIVVE